MAKVDQKQLTWQEKLKQGMNLSVLEETQADADFNFKQRLREQKERARYEKMKAQGRLSAPVQEAPVQDNSEGKGE